MKPNEELQSDELELLVKESIERTQKANRDNWENLLRDCHNIHVSKVHLDGLNRTKRTHFNHRSLFTSIIKAKSVQELFEESVKLKHKLTSIGVFKDVDFTVDASPKQPLLPDVKCVELVCDCKELNLLRCSAHAMAGSNELTGQTELQLANIFGRGEALSFGYSKSTTKAGCYSLDLTKLVSRDFNTLLKLSAIKSSEPSFISQYDLKNIGGAFEISRPYNLWSHTLRYSGLWRNFHCPSWETPFDIRLDSSGHSIFSSLALSSRFDTRGPNNNSLRPGLRFENKFELAGKCFGGDHDFIKLETKLKKIIKLTSWARLSCSLNFGNIVPLDSKSRPPSIVDRFFLGGPSSIRGFMMGGVGPHQNNCAFGGATYWSSGLSLYSRLPFRPGKGGLGDQFWLHAFINVGNLFDKFDFNQTMVFNRLGENLRYSIGAGIHWRFLDYASIELNYCIPKKIQPADRASPGFQLGISIDVL